MRAVELIVLIDTAYRWSTHNWTQGGQAAVDACRGTVYLDYGVYGKLFAAHNHCGGAWILQIKKGDIIKVTGKQAGLYKAINSKAVGRLRTLPNCLPRTHRSALHVWRTHATWTGRTPTRLRLTSCCGCRGLVVFDFYIIDVVGIGRCRADEPTSDGTPRA